jgi:hypothetical protein
MLDARTIDPYQHDATAMNFFTFEYARYATILREEGFAHVRSGLTTDFQKYLLRFLEIVRSGNSIELSKFSVPGKKTQYLFEFPTPGSVQQFMLCVSKLLGCSPVAVRISERHIKHYLNNAPPFPAPHKDRCSSELAFGIPLASTPETFLSFYPGLNRAVNVCPESIKYPFPLPEAYPVDQVVQGVKPVCIRMELGDLVIFQGSAIYHERMHAARCIVLYLKANSLMIDPLNEHPYVAHEASNPEPIIHPDWRRKQSHRKD